MDISWPPRARGDRDGKQVAEAERRHGAPFFLARKAPTRRSKPALHFKRQSWILCIFLNSSLNSGWGFGGPSCPRKDPTWGAAVKGKGGWAGKARRRSTQNAMRKSPAATVKRPLAAVSAEGGVQPRADSPQPYKTSRRPAAGPGRGPLAPEVGLFGSAARRLDRRDPAAGTLDHLDLAARADAASQPPVGPFGSAAAPPAAASSAILSACGAVATGDLQFASAT